jgi:purine-binding chemotaxis protein CheW
LPNQQWLSFKLGPETYIHAIDAIKEIIPYKEPTPVPGAPAGTEGILNVRGKVITVISGHALLRLEREREHKKQWCIIILELDAELIGVSVDSVGDIINLNPDHIERTHSDSTHQQIKGTAQHDGQLHLLINFDDSTQDPALA